MSSWEQHTSPLVKFENSPAESFISNPSEIYPSLFAATTPTSTSTMNPLEIMTPQSFTEDKKFEATPLLSSVDDMSGMDDASIVDGSSPERKTKKRKSWGQVLPEPKTNLPPR
jgi:transcriptional activator HAC1